MSSEILRRAANVMRETHRQDTDREARTFVALADALDQSAAVIEEASTGPLAMAMSALAEPLVSVARQYLGATAPSAVALDPNDGWHVKALTRALHEADVLDPSWDESVTRNKVASAIAAAATYLGADQ